MKRTMFICYFVVLCIFFSSLVSCADKKEKTVDLSIQTEHYYPENWSVDNPPEKHIEIIQFYHADKCDTCTLLQYTLKKLLDTKYSNYADKGTIIYRGIATNYIENLSLKQEFFVMEEDLCGSISVEGNFYEKDRWVDVFQTAENNPEQLEEKIIEKIELLLAKLSEY
ncbi:MAG: hypothetical protein KAH01_01490 [Caldisericia bacterium]|nr:hypothetical protein [Caldisericia bacterium]